LRQVGSGRGEGKGVKAPPCRHSRGAIRFEVGAVIITNKFAPADTRRFMTDSHR
jgi:hypothetical protein